jgi:hypothetical protein
VQFFRYSLVAMLAAALAGWGTYRLLAPSSRGPAPVAGLPARPAPVSRPTLAPGPSAAELERLGRENARLAEELAETQARLERSERELAGTRENLEELRRPMAGDLLSSALRAELQPGEVVVTGGYRLPGGARLYAFVEPTVERIGGKDVVKIAGAVRSISDAAGTSVGLDNLATNADNTLQHGEVWLAEEQREVFAALDATEARAIALPAMTVEPGASSTIEFGELRLKVTPGLGADRKSLDFEVRLEQARPAVPDEPEAASSAAGAPVLAQ